MRPNGRPSVQLLSSCWTKSSSADRRASGVNTVTPATKADRRPLVPPAGRLPADPRPLRTAVRQAGAQFPARKSRACAACNVRSGGGGGEFLGIDRWRGGGATVACQTWPTTTSSSTRRRRVIQFDRRDNTLTLPLALALARGSRVDATMIYARGADTMSSTSSRRRRTPRPVCRPTFQSARRSPGVVSRRTDSDTDVKHQLNSRRDAAGGRAAAD